MTENDAHEVNRPTAEEAVLYFFDNVTFGHMDEIPDEHLVALLEDCELCGKAMAIMVSGNFCADTEDPMVFAQFTSKVIVSSRRLFIVFRSWLFLERCRRIGKLGFDLPDILLKEMPYNEEIFKSKNKEIWNGIKESVLATIKLKGEKEIEKK